MNGAARHFVPGIARYSAPKPIITGIYLADPAAHSPRLSAFLLLLVHHGLVPTSGRRSRKAHCSAAGGLFPRYRANLTSRRYSSAEIDEQIWLIRSMGNGTEVERWNRILTSEIVSVRAA